jgi:hypothetical protein
VALHSTKAQSKLQPADVDTVVDLLRRLPKNWWNQQSKLSLLSVSTNGRCFVNLYAYGDHDREFFLIRISGIIARFYPIVNKAYYSMIFSEVAFFYDVTVQLLYVETFIGIGDGLALNKIFIIVDEVLSPFFVKNILLDFEAIQINHVIVGDVYHLKLTVISNS